jgi:hypothetical protein
MNVAEAGNNLQILRLNANILSKGSRAADKGQSSNLGVGRGAKDALP